MDTITYGPATLELASLGHPYYSEAFAMIVLTIMRETNMRVSNAIDRARYEMDVLQHG